MNKTLAELGLNANESKEFKDYWLDALPKRPYYEIRQLSHEFLDDNMGLNVYPSPDSIIRVNFVFKGIYKFKKLINPNLVTPNRCGFTLVE